MNSLEKEILKSIGEIVPLVPNTHKKAAREISDKFERFVEWLNNTPYDFVESDNVWKNYMDISDSKTLSDLFQYWLTEIDKTK